MIVDKKHLQEETQITTSDGSPSKKPKSDEPNCKPFSIILSKIEVDTLQSVF